ncbi:MAG: hypothetical protein K2O87_08215 [Duncaniella freteri]|nr:hypothetical protein [Duncaniella freteri]
MSNIPITSGERRGLIVLIAVLLVVTLILTWRSCMVSGDAFCNTDCKDRVKHHTSEVYDSAMTVGPELVDDRSRGSGGNKRKKKVSSSASSAPPVTRSPRDERVN